MKTTRLFSPAIVLCLPVLALSIMTAAKTTVELKDAQGKSVGTAVLWSKSGKGASSGVFINATLHDLPPGVHAFHFHSKAQCDAPDFKSAGPHFNPDGKKHGLENPEGHHAGDMNNFTVNAKGRAKFKTMDKDVTLGDDSHSLFSNGGTALMIHAKADDMKSDPAGNAGDRIACGVITK
jgi:Cu-Zn family superoxide dismutase